MSGTDSPSGSNPSDSTESDVMIDARNVLDSESHSVWLAYNAMFETKQRHYDFLEILENKKKKFNIYPSETDKQKLEEYLAAHDSQVKEFTRLSMGLKSEHPASHKRLFEFIAKLDGEPSKKIQH